MLPVLALLAFAGQAPAIAAPPARAHVFDFRLAAETGTSRAFTDMNLIARSPESGGLVARVYWLDLSRPPVILVADITVDCNTRLLTWGYTAALDTNFRTIENPVLPFGSTQTPDVGSTTDKAVVFVCASRPIQQQRPYLGSEWKSAVRMVDPRFR